MKTNFAQRATIVLKESGLNQTNFADRISISQQYLSQICSGKKTPSDRTIKDICKEFNVSEDWLRYGKEPMRLALSRDEEIEEMVNSAMRGSNDLKKAVIKMICSRTDEELRQLEEMLRETYDNLLQYEAQHLDNKKLAAARSGDRVEVSQVSEEAEEAALPPSYTGDI